jgi:microcystin-dependent protein
MPLSLPNDFANGQVADASPVDENYGLIESYINGQVINTDGAVGMQAPLLLSGDPTQPNHAANKDYVDNVLPVGIIMPWPGAGAPAGTSGTTAWLLCDGRSLQQAAYPELFGVLGLGYGTTVAGEFRLPSLAGRVMVGLNTAKTDFNVLGKQGGVYAAPLPQHSHDMTHNHDMTHIHDIDHNHVQQNTGGATTDHQHDLPARTNSTPGTSSAVMMAAAGSGNLITAATGNDVGAHVHAVDIAPFAGNSGASTRSLTATSSADNTGVAGVAGVEHLPPYVTINFIIKAL